MSRANGGWQGLARLHSAGAEGWICVVPSGARVWHVQRGDSVCISYGRGLVRGIVTAPPAALLGAWMVGDVPLSTLEGGEMIAAERSWSCGSDTGGDPSVRRWSQGAREG